MSLNKPSEAEDEYFAREEAARRQREALEQSKQMAEAERVRLKQLHFMKCPKCGMDLKETEFRGVTVDKCYNCGYLGFDDKEIETILGHEHGNLFANIANIFRNHKTK
jgi:Zn-finger nucleic acid-binding protein